MSASCCNPPDDPHRGNEGYRRVLWAVLAINAAMFAVEVAAGVAAGSASLQADALDFLGDAGNYAISLFVVGMALRYRAASFGLLWAYREGNSNMRSAWVCTRNDVMGNLAVLLAALGVFGTGTGWPDVIVALIDA